MSIPNQSSLHSQGLPTPFRSVPRHQSPQGPSPSKFYKKVFWGPRMCSCRSMNQARRHQSAMPSFNCGDSRFQLSKKSQRWDQGPRQAVPPAFWRSPVIIYLIFPTSSRVEKAVDSRRPGSKTGTMNISFLRYRSVIQSGPCSEHLWGVATCTR